MLKDAAGAVLSNRAVIWSTSNAGVATVATSGLVSAVAAGSATITATSESRSATVDVSVRVLIATPTAGATQATISTLLGGAVIVTVPPGAVSSGTLLSVGPAAASSVPASSRLMAGSALAFGPEGTQFAAPITIALRFDATGLSAGDRSGLAIYLASSGDWDRVAGSTVSSTDNIVSAPVTHFSVYAVLKRADPATVGVSAGNNQTATAGTAVAVRPSVTVRDARGRAVEGIAVQFAVTGGGGSVVGGSQVTDVNGVATVGSWTLGAVPGANTLSASVAGLPAATFAATASAPPPPTIRLAATTAAFTYSTGNAAPAPQTVSVTNGGGSPLNDLAIGSVLFIGGSPGWLNASLSSASAPSTLTLTVAPAGLGAGSYTAIVGVQSASSSNSPQLVTVTLTVVASVARQLVPTTQPSGARSGVVFGAQPVVEIRDAAGSRVVTATNTVVASIASGDGVLTGTTSVTAVGGVASFTDLLITGRGLSQIVFESGALAPATSQTFWVADGTAATLTLLGGNGQTGVVSTTLPAPLTVRVTDVDGFAVPGVTVTWTLAADGSLASATSVTNASGVASNTWTLGTAIGIQTVNAVVVGASGSPLSFTATATAPPASVQRP